MALNDDQLNRLGEMYRNPAAPYADTPKRFLPPAELARRAHNAKLEPASIVPKAVTDYAASVQRGAPPTGPQRGDPSRPKVIGLADRLAFGTGGTRGTGPATVNVPQRQGVPVAPVPSPMPAAKSTPVPQNVVSAQSGQIQEPVPQVTPSKQVQEPARPVNPEPLVQAYTDGHSTDANQQLNALRPQPIANTDYSYAGKYGDTQAIVRPTIGKDGKPVVDTGTGKRAGQVVPEFTDQDTAFNRPVRPQSAEAQAAEAARVQQAQEDYARNTTGSDGRRYYGGPETEALRAAQLAQAGTGDADGTVSRQLAEEGLTPEQRAAYEADPAGAYNVDAKANSDSATAQLDAFKMQYDMNRNAKTDARLNRTAAMKELGAALTGFKNYPDVHAQLSTMAEQQYDPSSGESMSSVVARLLSSLQMDGGIPEIDENTGQLVQREQQTAAPTETGSIFDTFL